MRQNRGRAGSPAPTPRRLFVFGLGYSALALARRLKAKGWTIAGTCRGEDKRAVLAAEGIDAALFDGSRPLASLDDLTRATYVLSSAPPVDGADPVLTHHAADLGAMPNLKWIGYLSTTGVYGDRGGEWVNEQTGLHPTTTRGKARVVAERAWLDLGRVGQAVHIFRLAGIYGPGRSALDTVRSGRAKRVVKPGQIFSRIHVDDIAAVLEASMLR